MADYAHPGALVVAGRVNYSDPVFEQVAAAGGHVLLYLDALFTNSHGRYHDLLMNASVYGPAVPAYPGGLANSWGPFADFRVGSVLHDKLEPVLELMVAENPHMAGWFADDLGSRPYDTSTEWASWTATQRAEYRDGAIAVAQTWRTVCDRHGLIVIHNGTWDGSGGIDVTGGGYPNANTHGCSLADGGCAENHDTIVGFWGAVMSSPQWAAASQTTGGIGVHVAIVTTQAGQDDYVADGAFAYVANQADLGLAPPPWGAFHPTGLPTSAS